MNIKLISCLVMIALTVACGKDLKGVNANISPVAPMDVQQRADGLLNKDAQNKLLLQDTSDANVAKANTLVRQQMIGVDVTITSDAAGETVTANTTQKFMNICSPQAFISAKTAMASFAYQTGWVTIPSFGRAQCLDSKCQNILLIVELTKYIGMDANGQTTNATTELPLIMTHDSSGNYIPMLSKAGALASRYLQVNSVEAAKVQCPTTTAAAAAVVAPVSPTTGAGAVTSNNTTTLSGNGINNNSFF